MIPVLFLVYFLYVIFARVKHKIIYGLVWVVFLKINLVTETSDIEF